MVLEAGGTGCIWGPVRQSTVGTAAAVLLQGQLLFPECRLGIYCSMIRIYRQKAIRGHDARTGAGLYRWDARSMAAR